jgi:ParB-like chromosome segregation protein Spo0J
VLDDVAKIAQDKIKAQGDEFNRDAEKRKLNLIETTQKSLETLENKEKITLAELGKVLKSSIDEIEKLTKDSLQKINTETDKAVKKMKIESESGISLIHKATDESGYKILKESKAAMDQVKQTASEELKNISAANKQKEEDDYAAAKKSE